MIYVFTDQEKSDLYANTLELLKNRQKYIEENQPFAVTTLEAYEHVLGDIEGAGEFDRLFADEEG